MWGSKLIGNYASKIGGGLMGGLSLGVGAGAQAWRGAGSMMGRTGRAAALGGAAGGMYGAFAEDTSILGGMAGGALVGAGARYGASAYRGARLGARMTGQRFATSAGLPGGSLAQGMGGGALRGLRAAGRRDWAGIKRSASLAANAPLMRVQTMGSPMDWLRG